LLIHVGLALKSGANIDAGGDAMGHGRDFDERVDRVTR
jgi:hypothetical protein